jgi:hypothetical protein
MRAPNSIHPHRHFLSFKYCSRDTQAYNGWKGFPAMTTHVLQFVELSDRTARRPRRSTSLAKAIRSKSGSAASRARISLSSCRRTRRRCLRPRSAISFREDASLSLPSTRNSVQTMRRISWAFPDRWSSIVWMWVTCHSEHDHEAFLSTMAPRCRIGQISISALERRRP